MDPNPKYSLKMSQKRSFCRNNDLLMENHGLRTHNNKYVLKVQLEIPQMPHNLFCRSVQIGQLFGILLKGLLHMSMHRYILVSMQC